VDPAGYPRPQLRREGWVDLCGTWGFAHDDADRGIAERWFEGAPEAFGREIVVPFPPESEASGLRETGFHPVVWYRRSFAVTPGQRAGRLVLHFGAVDYRARVWVNGRLAASHEGGHTPFSADITPLLVDGAEQVVVVRAEDQPTDLRQPRGKQFWREELRNIWYHRTTGIWQPVWLEPLPALAITELRWTPDLDRFGVHLTVRFDAPVPDGARLRVRLTGARDNRLADDSYSAKGRELRRTLLFDLDEQMGAGRLLNWAPHSPLLIDALIELVDAGGAVIDRVESYFGMRTVEVRDGRFHLNGAPIFMRLVLAQNYWPESHLAAPSADALRREVELAKALGFNGVRIHQKIEDPRFLYWCDRLGMMVWAEAANAYAYDDQAAERLTREWLEAVRRDWNHPSVVAWVPLNESWGVPNLDRSAEQRHYVKALYHLTRSLDSTRPVIANDGWQHAIGDIFGIHDYAQDPQVLRDRYGSRANIARTFTEVRPFHYPLLSGGHAIGEEAVVLSEFGGITFRPATGQSWFGYETVEDAEGLLERYRGLIDALLDSTALAGFCYTQLTDTEQETNGLLTPAREHKLDPDAVRAINTRPSAAIPSEILEAVLMAQIERRRRETAQEQGS
jgi:beta-galactosidase/beta-glucuronidase